MNHPAMHCKRYLGIDTRPVNQSFFNRPIRPMLPKPATITQTFNIRIRYICDLNLMSFFRKCIDQYDVWSLGYSPIKNDILENMLHNYPSKRDAKLILYGFKYGNELNYRGLRLPQEYGNLLSVKQNPFAAINKLKNEIDLGRMAGPFDHRPISNLRCSPIGLVP